LSEAKKIDEGAILKALVKQGAFSAAKEYVDFLEKKALPRENSPRSSEGSEQRGERRRIPS